MVEDSYKEAVEPTLELRMKVWRVHSVNVEREQAGIGSIFIPGEWGRLIRVVPPESFGPLWT